MIARLARGTMSAARGAATVTYAVARHAAWYLRYQVEGSSRAQDAPPDRRRRDPR